MFLFAVLGLVLPQRTGDDKLVQNLLHGFEVPARRQFGACACVCAPADAVAGSQWAAITVCMVSGSTLGLSTAVCEPLCPSVRWPCSRHCRTCFRPESGALSVRHSAAQGVELLTQPVQRRPGALPGHGAGRLPGVQPVQRLLQRLLPGGCRAARELGGLLRRRLGRCAQPL